MSQGLAARLKTETRDLHTAAERSPFMGELLRGRMARPAYLAMLGNLHAIYVALEAGLARHASHPNIAPIAFPGLARGAAIAQDLRALSVPGETHAVTLQPTTRAYVARLHELEAGAPALLLAHAYVRYLGDLSGGQVLRGIVARMPWAQGLHATAFYEFGDEVQAHALTAQFRDGLVAVQSSAGDEQALVDEARWSFEAHRTLFGELALASHAPG